MSGKLAWNNYLIVSKCTRNLGSRGDVFQSMNHSRTMPALSRKYHTPDFPKNRIPDLSPKSLRSLTDRIESNLTSQGIRADLNDTVARPKAKTPIVEKNSGDHAAKSPISAPAIQTVSYGSTAIGKQRPTGALKPRQGKKRLRDGRIKEESDGTKGSNTSAGKVETSKRTIGSDKDNSLDKEIRALGGTKDDFDLIANIVSESEMEDEEVRPINNSGNVLQKEILQLVRHLGVDKVAKEELMADSAPEVADEFQELEENRNPDMTPSNKELHDIKLVLQNATSVGRSQRTVVSQPRRPFLGFSMIMLTLVLLRFFSLSQTGSPWCYPRCLYRPKRPSSCLMSYWIAYTIMPEHFWNTRIHNTRSQADLHPLHISSIPPSCQMVRSQTKSRR